MTYDEALERLGVGVFIQRLGRGEERAVTGEQVDRGHFRSFHGLAMLARIRVTGES